MKRISKKKIKKKEDKKPAVKKTAGRSPDMDWENGGIIIK